MQTFYFVSMDGFLQFASVITETLEDAQAELRKERERVWVLVSEVEYYELYTEVVQYMLE